MKKSLLFIALAFTLSLYVSCEVAQPEPQVTEQGDFSDTGSGSGSSGNGTYDYSFTCSSGSGGTVPIPQGSTKCQEAWEYYARTYGCNDIGEFSAANCRICNDCGISSYCSLCQ